eukprot:TRINITY_DN22080_c0_g1_i3.p1 TRINITY_DN22080_c0_g1~~TRINITY_DN22080_c0_g1_i3.p1  ORF type:complete len:514 (-),score=96.39 TRINITY_DN22080_c0_g1_i3:104-1645(-)
MHSFGHTKRITDNAAYQQNLALLDEIHHGGQRWKGDGLTNLAFRVVDSQVDVSDKAALGITYHHVKVHRGTGRFDLGGVLLAVPSSVCASKRGSSEEWHVQRLDQGRMPWDLQQLRDRTAAAAGCEKNDVASANFILVDRRVHLAKLWPSEEYQTDLINFYRSLRDPEADGLIVADPRPVAEIRRAFANVGADLVPPTKFSVCTAKTQNGRFSPRYSVHSKPSCKGNGWNELRGGYFRAYVRPRPGLQAAAACETERYWTSRITLTETCDGQWAGLTWLPGNTFHVPQGSSFCIGTRESRSAGSEESFSMLLPERHCGGHGFEHLLSFDSVKDTHTPTTHTICIWRADGHSVKIAMAPECEDWCRNGDCVGVLAEFAARTPDSSTEQDVVLCVEAGGAGHLIKGAGSCRSPKFVFAVPKLPLTAVGDGPGHLRKRICVGKPKALPGTEQVVAVGSECDSVDADLIFEAPSAADLAASVSRLAKGEPALFSLIEEELPCAGFLCPGALRNALES